MSETEFARAQRYWRETCQLKDRLDKADAEIAALKTQLAAAEHARHEWEKNWAEACVERATNADAVVMLGNQLEVMGNANRELVRAEQEARAQLALAREGVLAVSSELKDEHHRQCTEMMTRPVNESRGGFAQTCDWAAEQLKTIFATIDAKPAKVEGVFSQTCKHRSDCSDIGKCDACRKFVPADEIRPNPEAPYSNKRAETVISAKPGEPCDCGTLECDMTYMNGEKHKPAERIGWAHTGKCQPGCTCDIAKALRSAAGKGE